MPTSIDPYKDMHKLSMAGTMRYMAAEALSGKPYNLKADVYTFGVVLWELLSLHRREYEIISCFVYLLSWVNIVFFRDSQPFWKSGTKMRLLDT